MTPAEYKQERKRRGLTQTELAKLLGVTQGTVSDRERGRRGITHEAELAIRSLPICNPDCQTSWKAASSEPTISFFTVPWLRKKNWWRD